MRRLATAAALALALVGLGAAPTSFGWSRRSRRRAGGPAERGDAERLGLDRVPGLAAEPPGVRRDADVRPAARPLAARRRRVRRPVAGAGFDQQDRVELRRATWARAPPGAIGWMQFMPSTWERWGVDADGDGIANPWSPDDAIAAAARYLAASGGQSDISRAVFSYNHAQWYVDEVLQLAQLVRQRRRGRDVQRSTGSRSRSIRRAASSSSANRKLVKALAGRCARSAAANACSGGAAAAATLLSDRLALDQRAVQVGRRPRRPPRLASPIFARPSSGPRPDLASARDRSLAVVVLPGGGLVPRRTVLRRPVRVPGRRRSLARLGLAPPSRLPRGRHRRSRGLSRLRALGRVVVRAWQYPDGRCGIGVTIDDRRRPELDVLPPLVPRPGRDRGRPARRRHPGRPRRLDRPCDGPAPAPAARPDDPRTRSCSRGSSASRTSPSAGRTPAQPTPSLRAGACSRSWPRRPLRLRAR